MGNFDDLRTSIAEVIKQNGNEEITGDVLQLILLEMVSGLGAGYRFLGTCNTQTEPQEPDGAAFYIGGAGEYLNFNGISPTVADGYICFFKWDGAAWSYSLLKVSQPVDDEITDGGQNPVKGGAIYDEFQKLRAAGYLFAGVAIPGTDPGEVTEKVFYVATDAGTYTKFGNVSLARGLHVLRFNGTWQVETLFVFTDDIAAQNAALTTSGGVFDALIGLKVQIDKELDGKQDTLKFDQEPIEGSGNPVTSGGISQAIKDFITKAVDDLINYYTKTEVYTKEEVLQMIAAVKQFRYEVVSVLPEPSADTIGIFYFVPAEDPKQQNVKDEYITLTHCEGGTIEYYWEKIGSTEIDLSNYTTFDDVNAAIAEALTDYYTKDEMTDVIAAAEGRLADVSIEVSKNMVQTGVSTLVVVKVESTIDATEIVIKRGGVVLAQGSGKVLQFSDVLEEAQSGNVTYSAELVIGEQERTAEVQVHVVDPVYYGMALSASGVMTKAGAQDSPKGRYEMSTQEDGCHIFVLTPMNMEVNAVEMSGIEVPMEEPIHFVIGNLPYKCYQSSNAYVAGDYVINVY